MKSKRLLLVSSSMSAAGYLTHCREDMGRLFQGVKDVCFVPFALSDWDKYEKLAGERFAAQSLRLRSIHRDDDSIDSIHRAKAFFVGGGNTFVLLRELQRRGLLGALRQKVESGVPYLGSSAGANIAGAGVHTTNDMPIVPVRSLRGLGFVPFNINPHYHDEDRVQMGETRDERIHQYHEYGSTPVVALFEDSSVFVENGAARVCGGRGARIFRKGKEEVDVEPGGELNELLV